MRILITGMNKNQTTLNFFERQELKVVPSHYSLIRCLQDMDNVVIQKEVELGENIDEYDKVIVYLASPSQITTNLFYNGLYVISQRPDCILAFDDWQAKKLYKDILKCRDGSENLYREFTLGCSKENRENIKKYLNSYEKALNIINDQNNKLLISAFSGGDITKLIDYNLENIVTFNPNPYHLNISYKTDFENKKRIFNFASLVQSSTEKWLKKQNIYQWPIEYFGNKSKKQRRLIESDMCKVYSEQWGCLMPGYDNAGSGWWRARPLQIADCESILIGDKNECMLYYHDEKLSNIDAWEIEDCSTKELTNIALAQKHALYKYHPLDKKIEQNELNKIL